jgi:uncharacterized protein (DUF1778 family)
MSATAKIPLSIRVHPDDKAEIERLASLNDLSITEYVVRTSTQRMTSDQRLSDLEDRVQRLEADNGWT